MDNRIVRWVMVCLRSVVGLALGALLVTGCHSATPKTDYVDIPELPGTPIGTPVATTTTSPAPSASPASDSSSGAAADPALSAPTPVLAPATAPADSTPVVSSSSAPASPAPSSATSSDERPQKVSQKHAAQAVADAKSGDLIRVGEMLHIVFSDAPTQIPNVDGKVKDDGTIILMYNETFHVADKTPGDVEQEIRKRYVPAYFAQLTASVIRDVLRVYYVDGEVKNASKQPYTGGPMTLTQAINSAGGFTDFANRRKIRLIRANGKIEFYDYRKLLEHPEKDPEVFPGDRIVVHRTIF